MVPPDTVVACKVFLLYYPLKQGLKRTSDTKQSAKLGVFTLLFIKARIETRIHLTHYHILHQFLLYYPLKQGLKHVSPEIVVPLIMRFYSTIH